MRYNRLGSSCMMVSEVCVGSTEWGLQNNEAEAHAIIDYAIERGVNFFDTAEMYPAPTHDVAYVPGRSEEILGSYLRKHPERRAKLVIASKVAGYIDKHTAHCTTIVSANRQYPSTLPPSSPLPAVAHLDAGSIVSACRASLRRLQTSYIDLFQLHWPDRYVPLFGKREYRPENARDHDVPFREMLVALKQLLDEGLIRAYGLSNETTFGVCQFVRYADELGMARPTSIQNSFCLLDRRFETELAEACAPANYDIALMPWSILAGGTLADKYGHNATETNGMQKGGGRDEDDDDLKTARFIKYPNYQQRFFTETVQQAAHDYAQLAERHGMSAATLAHAFCKSRWFIPSSIIGVTSIKQLKQNIDAFDVELSNTVLAEIDELFHCNKDCIIQG